MDMGTMDRMQKVFHDRADRKRYVNRMENPFIIKKEKRLAERIAGEVSSCGGSLLELGCGEGSGYHYLRGQIPNMKYVGMDFSFRKVDFFKSHSPGAEVVCADAVMLPFDSGTFDVVLCRDVLHHVDHAREILISEALRVLRPSGKVLIIESNGHTLLNRIFRLVNAAERGMKNSDPKKIEAMFSRYGDVSVSFIEASFLMRAVAYFLGWPQGAKRQVVRLVYVLVGMWESLVEHFQPTRRWTYMFVALERS